MTTSSRPTETSSSRDANRIGAGRAGLHLAALWALAVVQPLLDLLGRTPEFFVARGNTSGDIAAFALAVTILPPAGGVALEFLVSRLHRAAAWWLHLALVALLCALVVLPPLADLCGQKSALAIPLSLAVGALLMAVYARLPQVRSFVTVLAISPVVFLVSFLAFSPAAELVFGSEAPVDASRGGGGTTPVVMIVFDELPTISLMDRRGQIDSRRFPNFARLARDAVWYRNATTVADETTEAVPALLSGRISTKDALPISGDYPHNLFTLLAGSHRLEVVEPFTDLCPTDLCGDDASASAATRARALGSDLLVVGLHIVLPDDLRDNLPRIDAAWEGFAEEVEPDSKQRQAPDVLAALAATDEVALFREFTNATRANRSGSPPLHFIHVSLPHGPWNMLPTGQQYAVSNGDFPGLKEDTWTRDASIVAESFQRHLLQTGLADRLLGRELDALHRTGLYRRALVVVTADHGIAFQPGGRRRLAVPANLPNIAGVPLMVKEPGQRRGRIDDRGARTIDILPTIAEVTGAKPGWRFNGASLKSDRAARVTVEIFRDGEVAVSSTLDKFIKSRDARARRAADLLRSRQGPDALYLAGPRPDMLRRHLADVVVADRRPGADFDTPSAYANVDPRSPTLPVQISGSLRQGRPGQQLLVAVNGTIEATTEAVETGNEVRFSTYLPWPALREGSNEVALLEPTTQGALKLLARTSQRVYQLAADPPSVISPNGRRAVVEPGANIGFLDDATVDRGVARLRGWAAVGNLSRPVDRIVAFSGGAFRAALRPSLERPDVMAGFDDRRTLLRSGFYLDIPVAQLACDQPTQKLTVFGIADDRASELRPAGNVEARLAAACP